MKILIGCQFFDALFLVFSVAKIILYLNIRKLKIKIYAILPRFML